MPSGEVAQQELFPMPATERIARIYNEDLKKRILIELVPCRDLQEALECIRIIGDYSEFKFFPAIRNLSLLAKKRLLDGSEAFTYTVGREYSPAIYIGYRPALDNLVFDLEAGDVRTYTSLDFISDMAAMAERMGADEADISESQEADTTTFRFWWD